MNLVSKHLTAYDCDENQTDTLNPPFLQFSAFDATLLQMSGTVHQPTSQANHSDDHIIYTLFVVTRVGAHNN